MLQAGAYPVSYFDGYDFNAQAYAINNKNVAAGMSGQTDPKHFQQASVFSKTMLRYPLLPLQTAGCPTFENSQATGINDAGEVVGYENSGGPTSGPVCGRTEAVIFNRSGFARALFPTPQPSTNFRSVAEAINQRGDIVGYAGGGQIKAFLYKASCSCVTYIPRPIGENQGLARAYAVNASDDVVGDYLVSTNSEDFMAAFLATRGRTYDLNSLLPANSGWTILSAVGINDAREIIGYGSYEDPISEQTVMGAFAMKP